MQEEKEEEDASGVVEKQQLYDDTILNRKGGRGFTFLVRREELL